MELSIAPVATGTSNGAERRLAECGIFSPTMLSKIVSDHQSGRRDYSAALWSLLMFDGFLRKHEQDAPVLGVESQGRGAIVGPERLVECIRARRGHEPAQDLAAFERDLDPHEIIICH